MAAASINEETHRETQQTRTETQEKQRKSFISDRAEWSEARRPLYPKAPRTLLQATRTDAHTPTHTHAHAQTNRHTSDTRRHAKTRKVSFFAFWETCKEGFILLRASRSFAKTGFQKWCFCLCFTMFFASWRSQLQHAFMLANLGPSWLQVGSSWRLFWR